MRSLFLTALLLLSIAPARAELVVSRRQNSLTSEEIDVVTRLIRMQHHDAHLVMESAVWYVSDADQIYAHVSFETARRRLDKRFCQASAGGAFGWLSQTGKATWKVPDRSELSRVLYERGGGEECSSADQGRRLSVGDEIDLATVVWLLNNEIQLWNDCQKIMLKQNGNPSVMSEVKPTLVNVSARTKGRLHVSFVGDKHSLYEAELSWLSDKWVVQEVSIPIL